MCGLLCHLHDTWLLRQQVLVVEHTWLPHSYVWVLPRITCLILYINIFMYTNTLEPCTSSRYMCTYTFLCAGHSMLTLNSRLELRCDNTLTTPSLGQNDVVVSEKTITELTSSFFIGDSNGNYSYSLIP